MLVCFAPEKRLCLNSISTEGISNNFSQNEKDILHTLELIIITFTSCKRISLIIGTSYGTALTKSTSVIAKQTIFAARCVIFL